MDELSVRRIRRDAARVKFRDADELHSAEAGRASAALDRGNAVVCIRVGTHRRLPEAQMPHWGSDVIAVLGNEQSPNAHETLSKVTTDGVPDVIHFERVIRALADRGAARYPRISMIGELVELMRADGLRAAAKELENLWGSFATLQSAVFRQRECPALALGRNSLVFTHRRFGQEIPGERWSAWIRGRRCAVIVINRRSS